MSILSDFFDIANESSIAAHECAGGLRTKATEQEASLPPPLLQPAKIQSRSERESEEIRQAVWASMAAPDPIPSRAERQAEEIRQALSVSVETSAVNQNVKDRER